jgi:hypothetical protein
MSVGKRTNRVFKSLHTFLTKSGDLGMVLRVAGIDYESLNNSEQDYAVKRLESALKGFGAGFHVYQYLFKANVPIYPLQPMTIRLLMRLSISDGNSSIRTRPAVSD